MQRIERLLASLNAADVRYVIIGATAFAAHGWVRATADLDLFVDPQPANLERLRNKILLRQYDLPLDLHPFVMGIASFEEVWSRRIEDDLGGVRAPFASLDDLIAMKRAAGRRKDIEDLRELERIKRARS